jgi:hypothetical protein
MLNVRFCRALVVTAIVVGWALVTPIGATTTFDLTSASIADINAAFDAGALTSEKLTQLFLARIDAYDKKGPKLNAVLWAEPAGLGNANCPAPMPLVVTGFTTDPGLPRVSRRSRSKGTARSDPAAT